MKGTAVIETKIFFRLITKFTYYSCLRGRAKITAPITFELTQQMKIKKK